MEATTGFEPVNGSFADFCLTTWRRRHRIKMVAHPTLYVKSLQILMISMTYNCAIHDTVKELTAWNTSILLVPS